ncbi:hypothetical protein UACE39S_00784 [Ureibacillus acetophenoni]
MSLSVSTIVRDYSSFIYEQIDMIERTLHPSVTEDEELVRRALFAVRNKSVLFEATDDRLRQHLISCCSRHVHTTVVTVLHFGTTQF